MSSDEDCNLFSNFRKYHRKKLRYKADADKNNPPVIVPQKAVKRRLFSSSSESEEDLSVAYQRHLAENKERKLKEAKKPMRNDAWDEYDRLYKNKPVVPKRVPYIGLSPAVARIIMDSKQDERQAENDHQRFILELARAQLERDLIDQREPPKCVFIKLTTMDRPETVFAEHFKLGYEEQFAAIILKYAPMAGWSNPNDVDILWDKPEQLVNLKFFQTPEQLKMPPFKYVKIIMVGKDGIEAELRQKGDIKLKINLASQKKPIEKIILKNSTFGELKKLLENDLNVPSSKMKIVFDAEVIKDSQTPDEVDMEEADVIDLQIML